MADLLRKSDDITRDDIRHASRADVLRRYDIQFMDRKTWLKWRKQTMKGQGFHHRTHIGPTHRGKTTTEKQILASEITPDRQAVVLATKPAHRDPVMNKLAHDLRLVEVEDYPPSASARRYHRHRKYNGYLVRPHQTLTDLPGDKKHVRDVLQVAMIDSYANRSGRPVIVVCDEAHKICNIYKLNEEYEAPLMSGLPDCAQSSLIQRGRYMSYLAYDAPEEVIIFKDDDLSNQKRYSEIGGVDPAVILKVTSGLKTYETSEGHTISEFLYIRRAGPRLIIVGTE